MAQLSDDCFAFSGPLMPIEEAERLIAERVQAVDGVERVAIAEAVGRVVAEDIAAPVSLPPFRNSAVDGYAVRHADLDAAGETTLRVAQRVMAGSAADAALEPATAIRIFTGAPMPQDADTVFMQEDVRVEGDSVIVPSGLKRGANARPAGEDIASGHGALARGTRLRATDIALAAALGFTELPMYRRVSVALFSTGDEVVEQGQALPPARIYDANRPMLAALLRSHGAAVSDLGILRDEPIALRDALAMAATEHDLIVTSGGVSTGEADHVRAAVDEIGKLVFWRIAIKPGRPVAMGVLPGLAPETSAAFVGLPGNPAAVFTTFARIVRPLLFALAGARPEPVRAYSVRAGFGYRKKTGRREYVRVSLTFEDGEWVAHKFPREGAGLITSLTRTDGLAELEDDRTAVAPGERIGFIPYAALFG